MTFTASEFLTKAASLGQNPGGRSALRRSYLSSVLSDPPRYSVSGAILGCLGDNAGKLKYTVDEDLPDDPWRAIIRSSGRIGRRTLQQWHDLHNADPDGKGVPYYFIVKDHGAGGREYVWYTDDANMMPIGTKAEQQVATAAGKKKGLIPEQLDFSQ